MANRPQPLPHCNGVYGHHVSRKLRVNIMCFHACLRARFHLDARNRTRSSTRGNRTVENSFSTVRFLRVDVYVSSAWHGLPSAHVVHANHVQARAPGRLWSESLILLRAQRSSRRWLGVAQSDPSHVYMIVMNESCPSAHVFRPPCMRDACLLVPSAKHGGLREHGLHLTQCIGPEMNKNGPSRG